MKQNISSSLPFALGKVEKTQQAMDRLRETGIDLEALLERYRHGEWGCYYEEDRQRNLRVARSGDGVIVSQYVFGEIGIDVVVTTVMERKAGNVTKVYVYADNSIKGKIWRWLHGRRPH